MHVMDFFCQAEKYRAKMKFRRAMREEIMQKAPGMRSETNPVSEVTESA